MRSASPSLVEPRPSRRGRASLDLGVAQRGQALAGRGADGDGGQALLGVAAVLLQVPGRQGLEQGSLLGVKVPAAHQVVGQRPGLVQGPRLKGRAKLYLVDQPVLKASSPKRRSRWLSMGAMRVFRTPGRTHEVLDDGVLTQALNRMSRIIAWPRVFMAIGTSRSTLS